MAVTNRVDTIPASSNGVDTLLGYGGLVGLWAMSSIDAAGNGSVPDLSGNGLTLTNLNQAKIGSDGLISYVNLDGTLSQQLTIADEPSVSITGTEPYIDGDNGLTLMMWIKFDSILTDEVIASKQLNPDDKSWSIFKQSDIIDFFLYATGTGGFTVKASSAALPDTKWHHLAFRYTPSVRVSVFLDGEEGTPATVGVPSSIFDSIASVTFSGSQGVSFFFSGKLSRCAMYAASLSDEQITNYYQRSSGSYKGL